MIDPTKVGFYLKGPAHPDEEELRRSVRQVVGGAPGHAVLFRGPGDTVLRKLRWFRRGEEVSERRWQDGLSVLAASRDQLDEACLERWARELGIARLLDRARRDVADL